MEKNDTARRYIPCDMQEMRLTFTITGLTILKAHRDRMSSQEGRTVSLAKALDALLKSHPVAKPAHE